eukprot:1149708-Pelagomonas_calceolata.AAC.1
MKGLCSGADDCMAQSIDMYLRRVLCALCTYGRTSCVHWTEFCWSKELVRKDAQVSRQVAHWEGNAQQLCYRDFVEEEACESPRLKFSWSEYRVGLLWSSFAFFAGRGYPPALGRKYFWPGWTGLPVRDTQGGLV